MRQAFFGSKNIAFWTVSIALMWILLVFGDSVRKHYDEYLLERPWITAEIHIIERGSGKPLIKYRARPVVPVSGRWSAWVQTLHDGESVRGCGSTGNGNYRPNGKVAALWGWSDFLGADCPVPDEPYQLCARYAVHTESGAFGIFGPFCSRMTTP